MREVLVRDLDGDVMGRFGSSRVARHAEHASKIETAEACV